MQVRLDDPEAAAEAIVALDARTPLDAVVAVDDQGTLAAARASARLGLRHNDPAAVAAARDKLRMRTLLGGAEVAQPAFAVVRPAAQAADELARLARDVGPALCRQADVSVGEPGCDPGGHRSPRCTAAVERVRSIASSAGVDPAEPLLVEQFVPGPEVAVEGMLSRRRADGAGRVRQARPARRPVFRRDPLRDAVTARCRRPRRRQRSATQAATRALGLTEGPVHAELRVRDGRAWVIEVAARSIGGLCSRTLEFGTGHESRVPDPGPALGRPVERLPSPGARRGPDAADPRRRHPRRGRRA